MNIGIIGGGINGLSCAWTLAQDGHNVILYERDTIMQATSSASSKLLHGGIRYLENGQFRLVREALHERDAWLKLAPDLAKPLPFIYPRYHQGQRSEWVLKIGFGLYGLLSGRSLLPSSQWLNAQEVENKVPDLECKGLQGGYLYYDAQMDDYELGQWVAKQCRTSGVQIHENTSVQTIATDGTMTLDNGTTKKFDRLLNVTGPWAEHLLQASNIQPRYHLDLIRGSHIIIDRPAAHALILEVPGETRIFFILPWQTKTLIGTTEIRQQLHQPIVCTTQEKLYLVNAYNQYITNQITETNIIKSFAGLRPILRSDDNPGKASREYAIQKNKNMITIYGGKWTTTRALSKKIKI